MINTDLPIYLASKSPRRKKLLEQINLNFSVIDVNMHERMKKNEPSVETAQRIAVQKMEKAKKIIDRGLIITADTIVVLGEKILNKPRNEKDAVRMLKLLSGNTHIVYTGFAVYNTDTKKLLAGIEKTFVTFRKLEQLEIEEYVRSGSPLDKAGAYGIQDDFGAVFISKINGCFYNVVGLPLPKLYLTLKKAV
jgi:septum formation protein